MLSNLTRRSFGVILGSLLIGLVSFNDRAQADDKPHKLTGTWTWKWKDALGETHHHTLEVEGEGKAMVARERFDDQKSIKVDKIQLDGEKVTIAVTRGERRSLYVGKIASEDTINGLVTVNTEGQPVSEFGWTAKRESGGEKKP